MTNPASNRFKNALWWMDHQTVAEDIDETIRESLQLAARMERYGLVAVPKYPTERMADAMLEGLKTDGFDNFRYEAKTGYVAMISAYEKEQSDRK